jgi:chemotaxis protein CheZ
VSSQPLDADLARRIDELGDRGGAPTSWQEVRNVVESILTTLDGDLDPADIRLFAEVEGLSEYIQSAKAEVAALRPDQIRSDHIVPATDELDAVVSATEAATNAIMEAAETIEEVAERLDDELADALSQATTKIYEACSFQDITGQRIGKVVGALKEIEIRVDAIVTTFAGDTEEARQARQRAADHAAQRDSESVDPGELMHGPQLPDQAINQDDIDALFD